MPLGQSTWAKFHAVCFEASRSNRGYLRAGLMNMTDEFFMTRPTVRTSYIIRDDHTPFAHRLLSTRHDLI